MKKQHLIEPLREIEYVYFDNTKMSRELFSNHIFTDGKFQELNVFNDVTVKIALHHPAQKDFTFEPMDRLIFNAIASLYDNGIFQFTTDMIARIMYQDIHHRTTAKVIQTIQNRLDVMMSLKIRLNIEEEYIARKSLPKDNRLQKKQYQNFLPIKPIEVTFTANSKNGNGYHLYQSPILWEYAKYTKQIVKCSFGLFQLENHNMSVESLLILGYVHNQIELMKNPKNHRYSRKISLYRLENYTEKGVFPACGISASNYKNWNDKHRTLCKLIEDFLQKLKKSKDKSIHIKDYHYYKTKDSEGYRIDLPRKNYKKSNKKKEH